MNSEDIKREQKRYMVRSMKANSVKMLCHEYGVPLLECDIVTGYLNFGIDLVESHHCEFLQRLEKILSAEEF